MTVLRMFPAAVLLGALCVAQDASPAQAAQPPAPAQAPAENSKTGTPAINNEEVSVSLETFRKRVDEVNVIFTVTDRNGRFIKGLKQEDFRVLDDRKPPQTVVAFRSETNLPLRVGLLIDASHSIRDRFRFEQEAAIEFLNQTIRSRSDKAFVVGFDSTPEVTQDFTDSTEKLARGVKMLRPGGGSAIWDAVYFSARDKLLKLQENIPVRRALILLSDGDDNQSRVSFQEAVEMAQRAEVIVYAISTNVSGVVSRGDKRMQELAEATGGRVFFPMKFSDIAEKFEQIQEELRSQYAVAYKPADFLPNGRFRAIEILASNNKKLKVRARKGYYAPRQ